MRKPAVFLVAVLLGASYGLVKADQEVKIRGRVVYEPTGKPLTNVTVKLLRPDHSFATMISTAGKGGVPELLGTTKTDLNGNFSFETARPGPYDIECFRPGRHSGSGALNIDPRKFVFIQYKADPIPFTLRPGEKPPPIKQ
jgi:hypothetical protein